MNKSFSLTRQRYLFGREDFMESKYVEKYINFFTGKAQKAVQYGKFDKACMAGRISAEIQYQWNQTYVDEELEKCIAIMAKKKKTLLKIIKQKMVLFFFMMDLAWTLEV